MPIAQSKLGVKKISYDATMKFQESWVARFPWGNLCVGSNGNLHIIKCRICNEVEGTYKLLFLKWDCFYKHVGCKKVEKNIGIDVKKGDWYYLKVSKHAKNKKLLAFCSHEFVVAQIVNCFVGKKLQKVVQFATMLQLLQQGCPMLEYEALKLLFQFLQVPKNNKKHWNEFLN